MPKGRFHKHCWIGEKMDVALGSFPAPNRRQNRDEDDEDFSIPATSAMEYLRRVQ